MSQEGPSIERMQAITISREYGSGGGEIAARLASRLGWQLIDHEVVVQVARELGISEAEAEERDEYAEGLLSRLLANMQLYEPAVLVAVPVLLVPTMLGSDADVYAEALRFVVQAAVSAGQVVIVGRGGQAILHDRRDVLHVRVVAPPNLRIAYVMQRERIDQDAARSRIEMKDRDRHRYLQSVHHCHPEDPHLYDLVVNTQVLDLDSVVDLICLALECKAKRLSVAPSMLGPGAGLTPYSGQPSGVRLPESMVEPSK